MKTKVVSLVLASLYVLASCAAPAAQFTVPTAIPAQSATMPSSEALPPSETPAPEGEPVTMAQELTGVWELTSHPDYPLAYWLVREDGSYTFSRYLDGSSGQSGKWAVENGEFLIRDDVCPEQGKYSARLSGNRDNGTLAFTLIADNCPTRTRILTEAPVKLYAAEIVQAPVRQPTATFAPTPIPLALNEDLDVPYTSERALDVFAPQQPGKWPVVIFLHGGGLNKGSVKGVSRVIAGRGAVVFAPTWRSSESTVLDEQSQPVGYNDAACAVRFARANAADYRGDPSRIVLIGHSAGGAAGATIALAGDDFYGDCLVQEGSALPDAFVGLDGAYELPKYTSESTIKKTSAEAWAAVNPYTYINRQPIRQGVEFYINTGLEQELVADGTRLAQALQAAGYTVKYREFPGTDHMSMASSRPDLMLVVMDALGQQAPAQPTLTLGEGGCIYTGPSEVPTTFTLTWNVEDLGHSAYIYVIATVDQGKTLEDLASVPAEDPAPDWLHKIRIDFTASPGTYTKPIDLAANSLFQEGPIYFVCFFSDEDVAVGAAGPIEVEK